MKKVFIDCGANKGQSVDWLRAKYDPYEEFEYIVSNQLQTIRSILVRK